MYTCYGYIIVKINCYWLPVKVCFQEWNLWPFKILLCVQIILLLKANKLFIKKVFKAICLSNNFVVNELYLFQMWRVEIFYSKFWLIVNSYIMKKIVQWLHYKMIVFVNVIFDVFICQKQMPSLQFIHSS